MNSSTSSRVDMTRRAPLRVVIREAAALAKVKSSYRFSSVNYQDRVPAHNLRSLHRKYRLRRSLDGVFLKEWSRFYAQIFIVRAASFFAHSDKDKRDVIFFADNGSTFIVIGGSEQEFYFVVGNFQMSHLVRRYSISLRASSRDFHRGGRRFGSKLTIHPASFATSIAWRVASLTPS